MANSKQTDEIKSLEYVFYYPTLYVYEAVNNLASTTILPNQNQVLEAVLQKFRTQLNRDAGLPPNFNGTQNQHSPFPQQGGFLAETVYFNVLPRAEAMIHSEVAQSFSHIKAWQQSLPSANIPISNPSQAFAKAKN